jgi:uncharacterized protein (UPF0335 family)
MSDFHAKYRAHQAHIAAVPAALEAARNAVTDFNGEQMQDGEAPIECMTAGQLRTLVAEVERLQSLVKQQQKDAAEEAREFQREAREIAAEARWQAQNEERGEPYGTY